LSYKPLKAEIERRNRIRLAIFAYAYEYKNHSLISDGDYDALSLKVDVKRKTGNAGLDRFWRQEFTASTGMWIRKHPHLERIEQIYNWWIANAK